MKIIRLYLQNLASLEGPYELDFTRPPLVNAGVFAITGQTGAGKSTLLDAICLALYGTTPRYHSGKDKKVTLMDGSGDYLTNTDVRGILKRGAAFGQAQVDFIGIDHRTYRATWSVRRAHNQPSGNLQPSKNRVESLDGQMILLDRTSEALDKIEELVGLNFEQFTRSVLLAQGDFTAFLKAEKKDKAVLLEKLSGTYEYSEISKRVYERHKLEKSKLDLLKDQLQSLQLLTEADLAKVHEELKEINKVLSDLSQQESIIKQGLLWHQQFQLLEVELSNAQLAMEETEKQWLSQASALQHLEQVLHARPALTDMRIFRETDSRINAREITIQALESTLSNLNIRHTQLKEELSRSVNLQAQRAAELEEATPIIDQGKLLEHQYQLLEEKHSALKDVLPNFEQKERAAAKLLLDINQVIKQQKAQVESLETWIKEHDQQRILAEQQPLLLSQLEEVRQIREQGLARRVILDQEKQVKADLEIKHKAQKLSLETQLHHLNQLLQKQKELEDQLNQYQPSTLQNQLTNSKAELIEWEQLLISWTNFQQSKIILEALQSEEHQIKNELGLKKKNKVELEIQLQRKSDELAGADSLLQRVRLVASENVEKLRRNLQPGEACLVCGSLDHPYRNHQPYSDTILQELEHGKKQLEEEQKKCITEIGALQNSILQLEQKMKECTESIPKQSNKVLEIQNTLSAHLYFKDLEAVLEQDRDTWINHQLQQISVNHQNVDRELYSYQKALEALNLIRKKVQNLTEETNRHNNQLAEFQLRLQSTDGKITQIEQERQRLLNTMESIRGSIGSFLQLSGWEAKFRTNPEVLADQIQKEVTQWQTALREQQELSVQLAKSLGDQLLLEQEWRLHADNLQGKIAEITTVTEAQKSILRELRILLGGLSSSEKKENLQKTLKECQDQTEQIQINFSKLEKEIEARKAEIARLTQENQSEKITRAKLKTNLEHWLNTQGPPYNWELLLQFSQLPEEQIEEDRNKAEALKQKRVELQTIVSERNRALLLHNNRRSTTLEVPQLESALHQIQGEYVALHEKRTNLQAVHAQDQLNRSNHQDLTHRIQEQELLTDRWAKLSGVIGSADGASFRNIAQQYTLDQLLAYSKIHLQQLSNRYELQRIPNELAIQIVDKDMGDEIRSVNSLSGGETFLVSLALALGLASLSAQQINVESLFIDEGFGSLDPLTLNIAMDALEQLQNQGRKVGVISHVQEMTERIPVQIQILKQQGGNSLLHIPK